MKIAVVTIKKNKYGKPNDISHVYEADVIDQPNFGVPFYNPHAFIHLEIPKELEERPYKYEDGKIVLDKEKAKEEYEKLPFLTRLFTKKDF